MSRDVSQSTRLPTHVKVFLWLILLISLAWLALWGYTGYFRAHIRFYGGFTLPFILVMVVPVLILAGSSWLLISAIRANLKKKVILSLVITMLTLVCMAVIIFTILFTSVLDGFLYG